MSVLQHQSLCQGFLMFWWTVVLNDCVQHFNRPFNSLQREGKQVFRDQQVTWSTVKLFWPNNKKICCCFPPLFLQTLGLLEPETEACCFLWARWFLLGSWWWSKQLIQSVLAKPRNCLCHTLCFHRGTLEAAAFIAQILPESWMFAKYFCLLPNTVLAFHSPMILFSCP